MGKMLAYIQQVTSISLILCISAGQSNAAISHPTERLLDLSLEELMDVRVSIASQFVESDMEVGSTVSLITEQDWQKRGARRFSDAIGHLPGVMLLPTRLATEIISIRGYAQSEPTGVATLLDGVTLSTLVSGTAQFDRPNINLGTLDRIEMIRGPGSAIYGTDAFHGVVSLHTFESSTDVNHVNAEYSNSEYYQAGFRRSSAINDDLRFNISAAISGQPSQDREYEYTDPVTSTKMTGQRPYEYQSNTVAIKLVSDQDKDVYYRFGIYWDEYDAEGFPGLGTRLTGGSSVLGGQDTSNNDSRMYLTQGLLGWNLPGEIQLETKAFYWNQEHAFFAFSPFFSGAINVPADESRFGINFVLKNAGQEDSTKWSVDVGTQRQKINDLDREILDLNGNLLSRTQDAAEGMGRSLHSLALNASTLLSDSKLRILYGGRIDHYHEFGTQSSPRLGLIYNLQEDKVIKLLYGRAFRAPIAVNLSGDPNTTGDPNINPETIDTYELVFMQKAQDWSTELVFFTSEWKDSIVAINNAFVNSGTNSANGIELNYQWRPGQWLVETSGSYVHSKNDVSGDHYVAFPEVLLNLGFGYHFSKYNMDLFVANRIHMHADEGPIQSAIPNPDPLKDYWRTDVTLTKHYTDQLSFFAAIKNLFDRDNFFPSVDNAEGGIPDEEITISAGIRHQF